MSSAPPFAAALAWSGHLRRRLDAHPDLAAWLANACAHPVSANVLAAWQAELSGPTRRKCCRSSNAAACCASCASVSS